MKFLDIQSKHEHNIQSFAIKNIQFACCILVFDFYKIKRVILKRELNFKSPKILWSEKILENLVNAFIFPETINEKN